MSSQTTVYRVFIASPGGLAEERCAFKDTLIEYNDSDGFERGAIFLPVGWELTLPGVGRPQSLINTDIERCDYFVLLLWDRWGSPTGPDGTSPYSSGVEEEFHVAMRCFEDHNRPMRQIVTMFKSVDVRQLSDPGPQFQRVLDFKKKLEDEKKLLFDTFDAPENLKVRLRTNLAAWLRDHEKGDASKILRPTLLGSGNFRNQDDSPLSEPTDIFARIGIPEKEGLVFESEKRLADGAARGDVKAMVDYGEILTGTGRLSQAAKVLEAALELQPDLGLCARALRWLGRGAYKAGRFSKAEEYSLKALSIFKEIPKDARGDGIVVRTDLGRLYRDIGRFSESEEFLKDALSAREAERPKNWAGIAFGFYNLASLYLRQSRYRESETFAEKSVELRQTHFEKFPVVVAESLIQLGAVQRALGNYSQSERTLTRSLQMTHRKQKAQLGRAWVQLGILRKNQGRLADAEKLLRKALYQRERLYGPEDMSVSDALGEIGDVQRLERRFGDSEVSYKRSLLIRERRYGVQHVKVALSLLGLAELYRDEGGWYQAAPLAKRALETISATIGPPVPFSARCQSVLAQVLVQEGSLMEAVNLLRVATETFDQQLGPAHPETVRSLISYRDLLRKVGKIEEAAEAERRVSQGAQRIEDAEQGGGPDPRAAE